MKVKTKNTMEKEKSKKREVNTLVSFLIPSPLPTLLSSKTTGVGMIMKGSATIIVVEPRRACGGITQTAVALEPEGETTLVVAVLGF